MFGYKLVKKKDLEYTLDRLNETNIAFANFILTMDKLDIPEVVKSQLWIEGINGSSSILLANINTVQMIAKG